MPRSVFGDDASDAGCPGCVAQTTSRSRQHARTAPEAETRKGKLGLEAAVHAIRTTPTRVLPRLATRADITVLWAKCAKELGNTPMRRVLSVLLAAHARGWVGLAALQQAQSPYGDEEPSSNAVQ